MLRRLLAIGGATVAATIAVLVFNRPAPTRQLAAPAASATAPTAAPAPVAAPSAEPAPNAPTAAPVESRPRPPLSRAPAPRRGPAAPARVEGMAAAGPATATLQIDSDVPGAQVFLDREYLGTAPVTARNVRPGSHRLNASVAGYDGIAETIDVAPGPRELTVRFKEVHLEAALDVIHKHRFGSCRGRLVATTAGLKFEVRDKGDAFSVPLAEVATFEVDYLKKNLRIELRNGRRYDFTDPDGNADRLFVFHRDVSKARERLVASASERP